MRFIADIMVGKLARYLRMAGYDVLYDNNYKDDEILDIARSEGRMVLSRDTLMFKRKEFTDNILDFVFIEHDGLKEQLKQLKDQLGIIIVPRFSRCIECNHLLESVDKTEVAEKVPPYVYRTQENFSYCPACKKYFWHGTHCENIVKNMKKMV